MRMITPPQSECIVTGTLSLVLRMSQFAGAAPLSFKKSRDGWRIRVSPAANLYGQVLSFILWSLSTATIAIDICVEPDRSYRTRTSATRIVWVADVGTVGLVVCAAAFTGIHRMKSLTVYMLRLQEINLKLNLYHKEQPFEKTRTLVVVCSMVFTVSIIILDYSLFIHQVVTEHGKVANSVMYIFYNISTIVLQVLLLTFSQIVISVLISLNTLNNCLKTLLQEIINNANALNSNKECQINMYSCSTKRSINSIIDNMAIYEGQIKHSPKTIPTTIRRLTLIYCSLCDVVWQVNDSNGPVLVALLTSLLLHLVITPYHVITNIFDKSRSDQSSTLLQINWAVLHFSNLLLIVEPCHRTHEEMELTKHLISQMARNRNTPLENNELLKELEIFYRHLILNDISYAPMKMFPLNRSLIVKILGSITTYLVVMIQL